jgi:N utilization substance protein A
VQSIIKELRGEKIDIIEWSDEPSVFAANALSPAKVSQVRITDINKRKMEVIVAEDQLSLAIGKKGQNVRLATRLVGWDIDIVSEEKLKKEIALQMGKMMASGEAVPLSVLEGVTPNQAETLAEKGIEDVEALAATTVDDLVEYLDVSLDEAETILSSAKAIVEARNQEIEPSVEGDAEAGVSEVADETPVESTDEAAADSGEASAAEPAEATDASVEEDQGAEAEAAEVEAAETGTAETDATETEAGETEAAEVEAETSEASDEDSGEEADASKQ